MKQNKVIFTSLWLEHLLKETEIPEPVNKKVDAAIEQIRQKEKNDKNKCDLLLWR